MLSLVAHGSLQTGWTQTLVVASDSDTDGALLAGCRGAALQHELTVRADVPRSAVTGQVSCNEPLTLTHCLIQEIRQFGNKSISDGRIKH